eukprot:scaffold17185_cov56-Attheya_sp.AAC.3
MLQWSSYRWRRRHRNQNWEIDRNLLKSTEIATKDQKQSRIITLFTTGNHALRRSQWDRKDENFKLKSTAATCLSWRLGKNVEHLHDY